MIDTQVIFENVRFNNQRTGESLKKGEIQKEKGKRV